MEDILTAADASMENDIQRGSLTVKSETLLYQYAYEPAVFKNLEVVEARKKYAAQHGEWNGVDRRYRSNSADN